MRADRLLLVVLLAADGPAPRRTEHMVTTKHDKLKLWCLTETGADTAYICLRDGAIVGGGGSGLGSDGSSKRTESWGTTPTMSR